MHFKTVDKILCNKRTDEISENNGIQYTKGTWFYIFFNAEKGTKT